MFRPIGIEVIPLELWLSESNGIDSILGGERCRHPILRISADA
jgi:hypothetical protein